MNETEMHYEKPQRIKRTLKKNVAKGWHTNGQKTCKNMFTIVN